MSKFQVLGVIHFATTTTMYDIILEISAFYSPVLVAEDHHTIDPSKVELQCILVVQTYCRPIVAVS